MHKPGPTRHDLNSLELRKALKAIQGPQTHRFLTAMTFDYGVIALCITLSLIVLNYSVLAFVLLLPFSLLVIACRQHALLVLMHDATHYLAHRNRFINDLLGDLFCGAPMGVKLATYRRDHLAHHQFTNTNADPDWMRKVSTAAEQRFWNFPLTESRTRFFAKSWIGSIHYLLRSFSHLSGAGPQTAVQPDTGSESGPAPTNNERIANQLKPYRNVLYLALLASLLATNTLGWFLLFWLAPLLVFLPIIMRLRSIAEHFALPNEHEFNATRNVVAGSIERFFLAPHYVGLHLDHHLVASVPWHRLPELNLLLQRQGLYQQHAHNNDGYLVGARSLLKDMTISSKPAQSPVGVQPSQSPA